MYNFYNRFSISSTFILTSITLIIGNSIQLSQHTYLSVIHIKSVLLDFRGSRHRVSGFLVGVLEAPGHPAAELSTVGVRNGVVEILTPLSLSLSRSTRGGDAPNSENETVLSSWADRGP